MRPVRWRLGVHAQDVRRRGGGGWRPGVRRRPLAKVPAARPQPHQASRNQTLQIVPAVESLGGVVLPVVWRCQPDRVPLVSVVASLPLPGSPAFPLGMPWRPDGRLPRRPLGRLPAAA